MPIRNIIKITCTVVLSLLVIILLFLGLRINSYKIFITSLLLTYYPMVQYVSFQIIKALVKHLNLQEMVI